MSLIPINENEILESICDWMYSPVKTRRLHMCVYCGLISDDKLFVSPNCNQYHYYHIQCIALVISESLSFRNQIPKCIVTDCNQSLNISESPQINASLYQYYQSKSEHIKQYKEDELLLNGYIREMIIVPQEIITLIHDFYKLICYTLIDCVRCQSMGYLGKRCTECAGTGYTKHCTKCVNGLRQWTEDCTECQNIGFHRVTSPCSCRDDDIYDKCVSCDGFGIRKGAGGRGECSDCNGLGYTCNKCDDGNIITIYNCVNCDGKGILHKVSISRCAYCDGYGNIKQRCADCIKGRTMDVICPKCNLNGSIIYTDFNKIVCKQQFCNECGLYYPKNMIIYWSGCCHTFCCKFIQSKYIESELDAGRIPICPIKDCKQELDPNKLLLSEYWSNINTRYIEKLKALKWQKNKFECSVCKEWHCEEDMLSWSRCGHSYMKECGLMHVCKSVGNGYVPCCCECKQCIELDDIELCGGKVYLHLVQTLKYKEKFKSLITWKKRNKIQKNEVQKVLKLRNETIRCLDMQLKDKIVDFLNLTTIKIADIKYLKVIRTKSQIPLFQVYLNDKSIAKKLLDEILNLAENDKYRSWSAGFWEVYNVRNRYCRRNNRYHANKERSNQWNVRSGVFVEEGGRLNRAHNW